MRLFATYELRVLMPEGYRVGREDDCTKTVANLPGMVKEIEENLTDLLPEGWEARIREEER
ncbi:MAG TPA: hypothetical protein VLA89_04355 [Gemmatimonadales bacterium]|nr:hypothetical protein [Gemmatimonadales bacterium]